MSEHISSSSVKASSVMSSSKVSSSSTKMSSSSSSGSTLSSSSLLSGGVGAIDMDIDALLNKSAIARDSARKLSQDLADMDSMMGSTGLNNSSSSVMSSSKKSSSSSTKMSSAQSSFDAGDGPSVKTSMTSHSASSEKSAALSQNVKMVDGQVVSAETTADKSVKKAESGKEKVTEDGKVIVDHGFKMEHAKDAHLKATKEMSEAELNDFFRQSSIAGKKPEALPFDKESNSFETRLLDLPEFSPQELTVKIVDGVISVVGSHEEVSEDGTKRSHSYLRRFTVPEGLSTDKVGWELDTSGILAITAGEKAKNMASQVHLNCTIFKPRSFFKSLPPK